MLRDDVEKRKVELEASADQQRANLNATLGAIEDCKYWLTKFDEEAKPQEVQPASE
jgi:hypothetical protein